MAYGDQHVLKQEQVPVKRIFYNGKTPMALEDLYKNQSIFLICNGPSIDGINLVPLDTRQTFGINNGGILRPRFWTSQDPSAKFSDAIWLDPTITKFVPFSHINGHFWDTVNECESEATIRDCPSVILHPKSSRCDPDTWLTEDSVCWGVPKGDGHRLNTMLAALHIIWFLGFRTVYIIGADFSMSEDAPYFFEEDGKGKAGGNNELYRLTNAYLAKLDPLWRDAGYHVYNATDGGDLTTLRRIDYTDALKKTEISTTRETFGLYRGIKEYMTKGILYYSHNTLDGTKLNDECRASLVASGLPITSVTHKPIDFGTNIVTHQEPSLLAMLENIVEGLRIMKEKYVFLTEHDCVYHKSHFIVPSQQIHFNTNAWRVYSRGYCRHPADKPVLSACSGPRKELLKIMEEKLVKYTDKHNKLNTDQRAYAGMIFEPRGIGGLYDSEVPILDFRHPNNTTGCKAFPRRWETRTTLPHWGSSVEQLETLKIREQPSYMSPRVRQLLGKYTGYIVTGHKECAKHAKIIADAFGVIYTGEPSCIGVSGHSNFCHDVPEAPKDIAIVVIEATAEQRKLADSRTIFITYGEFMYHPWWHDEGDTLDE